jgi:hypothetical protein
MIYPAGTTYIDPRSGLRMRIASVREDHYIVTVDGHHRLSSTLAYCLPMSVMDAYTAIAGAETVMPHPGRDKAWFIYYGDGREFAIMFHDDRPKAKRWQLSTMDDDQRWWFSSKAKAFAAAALAN